MKVCAIVVNYCTARQTIECVAQARAVSPSLWGTVVVDNASPDGSFRTLREAASQFTLHREELNGGFAAGCNTAARLAVAQGATHLWFLNPDTLPERGALEAMLEVAERGSPCLVGAIILSTDGRVTFAGGTLGKRSGYLRHHTRVPASEPTTPIRTEFLTGACILIDSVTYAALGPMPEEQFLYFEDAEWCERARRQKIGLYVVPAARVCHAGGASTGGPKAPSYVYYNTRNAIAFFLRYSQGIWRVSAIVGATVVWLRRAMRARGGPLQGLRWYIQGLADGFRGRRGRIAEV